MRLLSFIPLVDNKPRFHEAVSTEQNTSDFKQTTYLKSFQLSLVISKPLLGMLETENTVDY